MVRAGSKGSTIALLFVGAIIGGLVVSQSSACQECKATCPPDVPKKPDPEITQLREELKDLKRQQAVPKPDAEITQLREELKDLKRQQERAEKAKIAQPCVFSMPKTVPTVRNRRELGPLMEKEKFVIGAELGVQRGLFAEETLSSWPSNKEYHLIDLWAHQENYKDQANVDDQTHNQFLDLTRNHTAPWKHKITECRNYTLNCATRYPDGYFDYVYVDARHDFKGVYEDLAAWWPKLRAGGIMAGHDYITQEQIDRDTCGGVRCQDWTVNYDGTIDETGLVVKGAVDKFFMEGTPESNPHYRQVTVSYFDGPWNTWVVRK